MPVSSFVELYRQWDLHSFVLRVPDRVIKSATGTEILSELIASIGPEKIKAAQQKSKRCYLFQMVDKKTATTIRLRGVDFREIHLTPEVAFAKATNVFISRVAPEVPDADFVAALSTHGKVLSCKRLYLKDHPTILSGTRLVRVVLTKPVPFFFQVGDQFATATYRGQPPTCFKCREIGHRHADCPLPPSPRRHRRRRPRAAPPAAVSVDSHLPSSQPSIPSPPGPPTSPSEPFFPFVSSQYQPAEDSPTSVVTPQPSPAVSTSLDVGTDPIAAVPTLQSCGTQCSSPPSAPALHPSSLAGPAIQSAECQSPPPTVIPLVVHYHREKPEPTLRIDSRPLKELITASMKDPASHPDHFICTWNRRFSLRQYGQDAVSRMEADAGVIRVAYWSGSDANDPPMPFDQVTPDIRLIYIPFV